MIHNVTYNNEDTREAIDSAVGKPFGLVRRIKMGGIGSKRLIIRSVSPGLMRLVSSVSDIHYGNIELRPKGIVVYTTRGLERYAWPIHYHHLSIYNAQFFSIHAEGNYIQFIKNNLYTENHAFLKKMLVIKNIYQANSQLV